MRSLPNLSLGALLKIDISGKLSLAPFAGALVLLLAPPVAGNCLIPQGNPNVIPDTETVMDELVAVHP